MPKIKAYKGNRAIIPVDTARISTAYKCPWTDTLFGTKRQYVAHLKALRKQRMHRNAQRAKHRRLCEDLNNQPTFEKVIEWIHNHPKFFFDNHYHNRLPFSGPKNFAEERLNFTFEIVGLNLKWSPRVSNTHECPRGGVTNWGGRKEDAPTSYPGWTGRISYKMSDVDGFSSDALDGTGIHTGTGGGGTYEVTFFDSDWPEITRRREKMDTFHQLGGQASDHFKYTRGKVKA